VSADAATVGSERLPFSLSPLVLAPLKLMRHPKSTRYSPDGVNVSSWPQAAVEGCLPFRRCQGVSRLLANRPRPPPLTLGGLLRHSNSMEAKGSLAGRLYCGAGVRTWGVQ
jgi:hypothetical protein